MKYEKPQILKEEHIELNQLVAGCAMDMQACGPQDPTASGPG